MANRSGNWEIWVCDRNGQNAVQVTSFGGPFVTNPTWSPDGERLAFDSDVNGQWDIFVVSANGGKPQRMTSDPANDGNPSWSKDGRWIYFDSARSGQQQVWKMPANGGDAVQLTRDGGFGPHESPDGKFLYYAKALGGTNLWRIPVEGANEGTREPKHSPQCGLRRFRDLFRAHQHYFGFFHSISGPQYQSNYKRR